MSVDINWQTLTQGPDGEALAESIRQSINDRFQHITLPKIIRSVKVHAFDFGSVAPDIVLKDICDPLPDFYDDDHSSVDESEHALQHDSSRPDAAAVKPSAATAPSSKDARSRRRPSVPVPRTQAASPAPSRGHQSNMLGGSSNLGYFHLPLSAGLSGTATPLAAVAGARYTNGTSQAASSEFRNYQRSESLNSISPPSVSPPPSRDHSHSASYHQRALSPASHSTEQADSIHEPSPEDIQIVTHVSYSGDVKLGMTAEVFLDYPMPSFVGIPLKLTITGLSFDGVAVLAYIKRRAHLCFLNPEDADALIGGETADLDSPTDEKHSTATSGEGVKTQQSDEKFQKRPGGLLEDIKIETEIGQTADGKQVLKNVGKIEKFILEQVQRIFEDEFVYPSFWTFLV
ncbi:hypothetical protein MBLNU230_g8187t1 [Neophaeotheca triangularis]